MQHIVILSVAIALGHGLSVERPHSEYGVPAEFRTTVEEKIIPTLSTDYGVPKEVLPVEVKVPLPTLHDSYGVPNKPHEEYGAPLLKDIAPVVTQYDYAIPHIVPVKTPAPEYGIPKLTEIPAIPAVEYGTPTIHEEYGVPSKPHGEYGVPLAKEVAPIVTQYDYAIPHVEPAPIPAAEYGIPKLHEEYGVPAKPHDEYGAPLAKEVAPIVTQYEYAIPHVEPAAIPAAEYGIPKLHEEYGVPAKPHNEYGVPLVKEIAPIVTKYDYAIPHAESAAIPAATPAAEYGIPKLHEEYGVPAKPHDEYGVPLAKEIAPIVTKYDYTIPHVEPAPIPAAEYGIPKLHEEYGVPAKPHDEYGVPQLKEVAPIVTNYDYAIPHVERVQTPAPEYGIPKVIEEYGVPAKPHDDYGIPKAAAVAPVESTYAFAIPAIKTPEIPVVLAPYEAPKIQEEYGVPIVEKLPAVPVVPHSEYGVPSAYRLNK